MTSRHTRCAFVLIVMGLWASVLWLCICPALVRAQALGPPQAQSPAAHRAFFEARRLRVDGTEPPQYVWLVEETNPADRGSFTPNSVFTTLASPGLRDWIRRLHSLHDEIEVVPYDFGAFRVLRPAVTHPKALPRDLVPPPPSVDDKDINDFITFCKSQGVYAFVPDVTM